MWHTFTRRARFSKPPKHKHIYLYTRDTTHCAIVNAWIVNMLFCILIVQCVFLLYIYCELHNKYRNVCVTCVFIIIIMYYDNNQQHFHELVSTTNRITLKYGWLLYIYSAEQRTNDKRCTLYVRIFDAITRSNPRDIQNKVWSTNGKYVVHQTARTIPSVTDTE